MYVGSIVFGGCWRKVVVLLILIDVHRFIVLQVDLVNESTSRLALVIRARF